MEWTVTTLAECAAWVAKQPAPNANRLVRFANQDRRNPNRVGLSAKPVSVDPKPASVDPKPDSADPKPDSADPKRNAATSGLATLSVQRVLSPDATSTRLATTTRAMHTFPAHLLTFRTYGTWLPGAPQGYVDRHHNQYGTPYLPASPSLHAAMRASLRTAPVVLTPLMQLLCLTSFAATCLHRGWWLHDAVAMPTHCHLVVSGLDEAPADAIGRLKAYATRALRRAAFTAPGAPVWGRQGSTLWLFEPRAVAIATAYVARHRVRP